MIQAIVGLNAGAGKREDPAKNAADMLEVIYSFCCFLPPTHKYDIMVSIVDYTW